MNMPLECCTASQFHELTNFLVSGESTKIKLLWQRGLGTNIPQEKWLDMFAGCGEYLREAWGKFTQYKIIHRYYHTTVRLHRTELLNNKCWKSKTELGTFALYMVVCISGSIPGKGCGLPEWLVWFYDPPDSCHVSTRGQISNTNCIERTFFVIMVGVITASRVNLRHWKATVSPNLRDWMDAMVEMASYESMHCRLKGNVEDRTSSWELFWKYSRTDKNVIDTNCFFFQVVHHIWRGEAVSPSCVLKTLLEFEKFILYCLFPVIFPGS